MIWGDWMVRDNAKVSKVRLQDSRSVTNLRQDVDAFTKHIKVVGAKSVDIVKLCQKGPLNYASMKNGAVSDAIHDAV